MEFLYLLGLLLLAIPIIAIIALVKAITLGDQMRRVQARLAELERGLAEATGGAYAPTRPAPPPPALPIPPVAEPELPATTIREPGPQPPSHQPQPAPPIAATSPIAPPRMSLEERLGTQWAVWVGGLALALGGIFLVRYSIEQGLIGPAVRVALGALLAVALIVAGEWARRSERLSGVAGLPTAHIPSILTAA